MHLSPPVAWAVVRSKTVDYFVADLLFIGIPIVGVLCLLMFCCALLYALSSFATILTGKRELLALLCLSSWCLVSYFLWLFLTVPWVGL